MVPVMIIKSIFLNNNVGQWTYALVNKVVHWEDKVASERTSFGLNGVLKLKLVCVRIHEYDLCVLFYFFLSSLYICKYFCDQLLHCNEVENQLKYRPGLDTIPFIIKRFYFSVFTHKGEKKINFYFYYFSTFFIWL